MTAARGTASVVGDRAVSGRDGLCYSAFHLGVGIGWVIVVKYCATAMIAIGAAMSS